jgi:hypothetical protein
VRADGRGLGHGAARWTPWIGLRSATVIGAHTDRHPVPPDDDGGIYVLPFGADLDLFGGLRCDWRDGDVW